LDVDPLQHPMQETPKPARRHMAAKVALAGAAGLALAFILVNPDRAAADTLQMADMTWVEVRSAVARGYTTVIVPSGGIEQNGPHMVLGKHDYIVDWAATAIAKELGRTLVMCRRAITTRRPDTCASPAPWACLKTSMRRCSRASPAVSRPAASRPSV
jgi:hypothetical protein